ncbi:bifunctional proline dehydrogenase/L-glutamate gamma-semialdehyde dehydrogenase PutA [Pseudooceanicola sp. LIPI14-2-Ac024]|uniref:bifunctional proline dehydrogenase/L-glutamate gamma-semialdehyde dehydrogenase PutA n=1 Tax=Pseudooceanicola sp. LIPI14-2-Ac024 TaxID=3344875 RepID=UPI0035CEFC71
MQAPLSPRSDDLRARLDAAIHAGPEILPRLVAEADLSPADRAIIGARAVEMVKALRADSKPGLMETFLAEYGLSTEEGVALMCLAEALLRVPDADTIDALIEDKIAPSDWARHLGHSSSPLVNASTWGLMLTGRVLRDVPPGPAGHLRGAIRRLGEPVIRRAVGQAMKVMGRQFVLGEDIRSAMARAAGMEAKGYTYSYDMLGEAARTEPDALRYLQSYSDAIAAIAQGCKSADIRRNPGISVKLSALYPRYEVSRAEAVMEVLAPRLLQLAQEAKSAAMGLNIDAEEADRLSLSLDIIEKVLSDPSLAGWDGFGVVVQAYGPRAGYAIDWLHQLAARLDRRITVRLVKGAYWDTEVKRAQVQGLDGFPVFTSKHETDISYLANARKLLGMTDRIYPQFATHNALTMSAVLHMAEELPRGAWEFQRLHGMGEALHDNIHTAHGTSHRIYAPVGAHRDLLAYLVRRLLENGANSSFVNRIVNEEIPPEEVVRDPFEALEDRRPALRTGPGLFAPERPNSRGWDLHHAPTLAAIKAARAPFRDRHWHVGPRIASDVAGGAERPVTAPATGAAVGAVTWATPEVVEAALAAARPWDATPAERGAVLARAADLFEAQYGEIFAALAREAGKTLPDAVAEIREAVDFLRYYGANAPTGEAVGTFTCISPWNFPLAIFSGQAAAALAAGNAVLAKPAEQTPIVADIAVRLLHEAGVPATALQLLPGDGGVGAALTSDPRVGGVAFTGSTDTARLIRRAMAEHLAPGAPLIAETGGLNAMIVDSTALPEQAVQAVIESAFQSAGQRCSALRCLYVQEEVAGTVLTMLRGAMDALVPGDPWQLSSDLGPVIDAEAQADIAAHVAAARADGRLMHQVAVPETGSFIGPAMIRVAGIADLEREVFGPILHVATFKARDLDAVIDAVNATGFGLTFGLQTRIDDRVQHVAERIRVGNTYVNRNQIGAIVGSQPFGGEGLSGTGPKAGGPHYLSRFQRHAADKTGEWGSTAPAPLTSRPDTPETPVNRLTLPGPTGESNVLTTLARPAVLCLGPGAETVAAQAAAVEALGGTAWRATGTADPQALTDAPALSTVLWWGDAETARTLDRALAARGGPLVPLVTGMPDAGHVLHERHLCVDTTAAGGNAALLGGMA